MKDPLLREFLRHASPLKKKIKRVYLFGSRARGDEKTYSDYDLLIVVKENFTLQDKAKLYDGVTDILLESGRLMSLKIFKEKNFNKLRRMGTPFMKNVMREGIRIG